MQKFLIFALLAFVCSVSSQAALASSLQNVLTSAKAVTPTSQKTSRSKANAGEPARAPYTTANSPQVPEPIRSQILTAVVSQLRATEFKDCYIEPYFEGGSLMNYPKDPLLEGPQSPEYNRRIDLAELEKDSKWIIYKTVGSANNIEIYSDDGKERIKLEMNQSHTLIRHLIYLLGHESLINSGGTLDMPRLKPQFVPTGMTSCSVD